MGAFLLLIVVLVYMVFWFVQFISLMSCKDNFFPGKYDKLCWVLLFIFLAFIAPIAFITWINDKPNKTKKIVSK